MPERAPPKARADTTKKVLDHAKRAQSSIGHCLRHGARSDGLLSNPPYQAMALKLARLELEKAIAIIDHMKW
jgi:hypothetical protein